MKIAHTMIRVRDLDRSIGFYSEFLGLRETRRKDLGDAVLVFLADDDEHHFIELTYNKDGRDYELGNQFGHRDLGVRVASSNTQQFLATVSGRTGDPDPGRSHG